jgi:fructan beta-fructosidase
MSDPFRPQYHFTPAKNWINDPNGLVWFDGEYHLFYQYNPEGDQWGHMSWGHAVSTDLVHWEELAVAIPEDARHMIYSGSVVVDWQNSSGFGDGVKPPLIALYTGAERGDGGIQSQCLAYSHDRGRTWDKYAGNPVLDIGLEHFRDPKVFWHEGTARWVMVVSRAKENRASLYCSPDLKNWTHLSDIGPGGAGGDLWECPDLFPLAVENAPGEMRWVFKIDLFTCADRQGSAAMIILGDFDGKTFTPERDDSGAIRWQWADWGREFYAAMSWSDIPESDGRRIWIGWMNNHMLASKTPTSPWRGAMTVPRALSLRRDRERHLLIQKAVREIGAIRTETGRRGVALTAETNAFELHIAVETRATLVISAGPEDSIVIVIDRAKGMMSVDRSCAGLMVDNRDYAALCAAPIEKIPVSSSLQLLFDACSIELFADGGATALTSLHFLRGAAFQLSLSGASDADSMEIYPLAN